MRFKHVLPALVLVVSAACASSSDAQAPSTPQSPPTESSINLFDRLLGLDDVPNAGPCPLMGIVYDASRVVEFASTEERYANVAFTGEMRGVRGLCRYIEADPIEMTMEIDMAFGRGPAAAGDERVYRYWVAVTRRGVAPIEKQYFDVPVEFERGADVMVSTQRIDRIVIPRANSDVSGENFEILVGFDLTPAQLQFNRDGKRFRVNAADG